MDKKLNDLWKTVLGEIEIEVSRGTFISFFKKTKLISLENQTATIATSSNMVIDLLQKRFYSVIKKSLDKHIGKNTQVVFVPKTISPDFEQEKEDWPLFSKTYKEAPPPPAPLLPRVRLDFTFQTLAVSSSNQLAFVSAQTVAKNLGKAYNPLFIYGPVGVGKTHLMQAIANEVYASSHDKKIIYITSEEFTNEVVEAIRTNDTAKMKKRFRSCDLLIIDDVQFIAGKDRVQEELFHTFNILIDKSSQIVLSSDSPPYEIHKLERRLSSRFSAGLTVDIEPPDFELRCAILLIKAKKLNVDLPIEAAKVAAEHIEDVRSLEGALFRIITEAKTKNEEITSGLVLRITEGKRAAKQNQFHPDEVVKGVCKFYDIKPTLIKGPKRDAFLVRARQIAMYILKNELELTFVEIGNVLGGRDHTTIMHGVKKVEKMLVSKSRLSLEIMGITKLVSEQNVD